MLKQYEITLPQADIEFIDGALQAYAESQPNLSKEITETRLALNAVLPCETYECDNPRMGLEDRCVECVDTEAYYRAQYEAEKPPYTREEIMDAYSDATERAKRDILLERLG